MAMFVHLAPESRLAQIRRNGISRWRRAIGACPRGVFAVPVTRNFYASHQWLRELKRRNQGPIVGIYFRIPDDQPVWLGHYGQAHRWLSAADAVAEFATVTDPLGWEVVIPRSIEASKPTKFIERGDCHKSSDGDFRQVQGKAAVLHMQVLHTR